MDDIAIVATTYHEAGHAVAAQALEVKLRREVVTIIPDEAAGSLGSCASQQPVNRSIEWNRSDRNRIRAAQGSPGRMSAAISSGSETGTRHSF
jgi:ATP-dependent Zn protease